MHGTLTRLLSPFEGSVTAWQFTDADRVLLFAFRTMAVPGVAPAIAQLRDLPENSLWQDEQGVTHTARSLMGVGLIPALPHGDFAACLTVLRRV